MNELGTMVRSISQNPTESELMDIRADFLSRGKERLEFKDFVVIATRKFRDDPAFSVRELFKVFFP